MKIFLVTYKQISKTLAGLKACLEFDIRPFVDGSNRREPSVTDDGSLVIITSLCRGNKLIGRLSVGDLIVYLTTKPWYLTLIVEVTEKFASHEEAAEQLLRRGQPLTSNLMVKGNRPLPKNQTAGTSRHVDETTYKKRSKDYPCVVFGKPLFLELSNPKLIKLVSIFGKVPGTQTPKEISNLQYKKLIRLFGKEK